MGQKAKPKKIERGKPIQELVKGSREYTLAMMRKAFRMQFPYRESEPWMYIEDTFDDFVVVYSEDLRVDEFYKVSYERDGEDFAFADRESWEIVELAYRPQTSMEGDSGAVTERKKSHAKRLDERLFGTVSLTEANGKKARVINANLAQADVVNGNRRRYRREVLKEAVKDAQTHLHESLSQGRAILLGEAEHPGDKGQGPRLLETIVVWKSITFDDSDGWVKVAGEMIENSVGKDAIITMDAGVLPGISLRGYGESEIIKEDGQEIEEVEWLRLTGADLVLNPGFQDAAVTLLERMEDTEMATKDKDKEVPTGAENTPATSQPAAATQPAPTLTVEEIRKNYPEMLEALKRQAIADYERARQEEADAAAVARAAEREKELRELMGLPEDANVDDAIANEREELAKLREAEQKRNVTAHIEEQTQKVKYPEGIFESFVAYVQNEEPATTEEADAAIEKAKKVFDPLAANARLSSMGFRGVQVLGSVLENETGIPEFARPAAEIAETLRKSEHFQHAGLRKRDAENPTRAQRFAQAYLEKYDERYRGHLIREAQMWSEAMLTTQLNLPYSVLRAIIDEAFPELVALEVFDTGVVATNPTRVFYEASFVEETGYSKTVTDENITSDHDKWVALVGARLDAASVVVTSNPAGTTYTEGSDYIIDYAEGRIKVLSAGTMADATSFLVDYTYNALRKGENQPIEKARSTVKFEDLTLVADRLATDISDEVMRFSQSQLGYDAVGRTIALLVKEIRRNIDANLFQLALSLARGVASNSGGTWTSASDSVDLLPKVIGQAKVKVANRNYTPTSVIMSLTNSEVLSNAKFFEANSRRPDIALGAAGYVGEVKGLPVFASTQFPDTHILVANREVVMYRTMGDMELNGPYPKYDATTGDLIDNSLYFVREYNGQIAPIPQKASYVVIA